MSKYLMISSAMLAILAVFLLFLTISLRNERNELKTALNVASERIEELRNDITKQANVLAERETKINSLTADRNRLNRKLKEAGEREQEVKLWIDTRVPDAVSGLLKDGTSSIDPAATVDSVQ